MTQEDKELLLIDLCARLPYGLKGKCEIDASYDTSFDTKFQIHKFDSVLDGIKDDLLFVTPLIEDKDEQEYANEEVADGIDILDFKPYLRPMYSMTEEESAELSNIISEWFDKELFYLTEEPFLEYSLSRLKYSINPLLFDWFNANHFDYRGLIPKGLAIAVTEEDNPYL